MQKAKLTFKVCHPGEGLKLIVRLDGDTVRQFDVSYTGIVELELNDTDADHCLEIELSGKRPHHTKTDAQGTIIDDAVIQVSDLAFDEINLGQIFVEQSQYKHDHNGHSNMIVEPFYGTMGCNGTVRLEFSTPIYLWLLENM